MNEFVPIPHLHHMKDPSCENIFHFFCHLHWLCIDKLLGKTDFRKIGKVQIFNSIIITMDTMELSDILIQQQDYSPTAIWVHIIKFRPQKFGVMDDFLGFNLNFKFLERRYCFAPSSLPIVKCLKYCFLCKKVDHEPTFVMSFDFSANQQFFPWMHLLYEAVRNFLERMWLP